MNIQCPSCGAESKIWNPASISATCHYCDTVMLLVDQTWTNSGQQSRLSQGFSSCIGVPCVKFTIVPFRYWVAFGILLVVVFGTSGMFKRRRVIDTGSQKTTTSSLYSSGLIPPLNCSSAISFSVGAQVTVLDIPCQVLEVGEAVCVGVEGELPRTILPNERYAYADGSSLDGQYTLGIEYDDDIPTVFWGKWLSPKDIICLEP